VVLLVLAVVVLRHHHGHPLLLPIDEHRAVINARRWDFDRVFCENIPVAISLPKTAAMVAVE